MKNKFPPTLFIEREIKDEIMATDIYLAVTVLDDNPNKKEKVRKEILNDIDSCFEIFREFEQNYSRFIKENQLDDFNNSAGKVKVSREFFKILSLAKQYYKKTDGVFDISVYPFLVNEGYAVSSLKGFTKPGIKLSENRHSLDELELDQKNLTIIKPDHFKIEIGGLGKGFIVDKVSSYLKGKYKNFVVDAGGDIYYSGKDIVHGYDYWALEIENPLSKDLRQTVSELPILKLNNMAVATSGTYKRKWQKNGQEKNHLINPKSGLSLKTNLIFCTVIADTAAKADIMAKSILLMGQNKGINFANKSNVATLIMDKYSHIYTSQEFNKYVW